MLVSISREKCAGCRRIPCRSWHLMGFCIRNKCTCDYFQFNPTIADIRMSVFCTIYRLVEDFCIILAEIKPKIQAASEKQGIHHCKAISVYATISASPAKGRSWINCFIYLCGFVVTNQPVAIKVVADVFFIEIFGSVLKHHVTKIVEDLTPIHSAA